MTTNTQTARRAQPRGTKRVVSYLRVARRCESDQLASVRQQRSSCRAIEAKHEVTNAASLSANPPTIHAACYVRTARALPRDGTGVDDQRQACYLLATHHGLTITVEIPDTGVSCRRADRKGIAALYRAVEKHQLSYVICTDADRLARNHDLFETICAELRARGATVLLSNALAQSRKVRA